jgi:hypothetical protein
MEGTVVRVGWTILYVMASVWIVGMVMQATGIPFGPKGFATPPAPRTSPAGPALAPAPAVAASPAQNSSARLAASAAAEQHTSHASLATTETTGNQLLQPRLEGDIKVFEVEAKVDARHLGLLPHATS